jgi:2-polyprenyl-6-hydroxyphenyl methylase/3-demethylubiquinone-9 3-methyltransferase
MARKANNSIGSLLRGLGDGIIFLKLAPVYRRFFFSINMFVKMTFFEKFKGSLIDVGGGDGAVLAKILNKHNPNRCVFLDPTPNAGSMIEGKKVVRYIGLFLNEVEEIKNEKFDVALLVDVLHHVEPDQRKALLIEVLNMISESGRLIIKEVRPFGLRSKLTYWADIYISKDPVVSFISEEMLLKLILEINPDLKVQSNIKYGKWDYPNYSIEVKI